MKGSHTLFWSAIACAVLAASGCQDDGGTDEGGGDGSTGGGSGDCTLPALSNDEGTLTIEGALEFSSGDMDIIGSGYSSSRGTTSATLAPAEDRERLNINVVGIGVQNAEEARSMLLDLEDGTTYEMNEEGAVGAAKLRIVTEDDDDMKGTFCGTLVHQDDPSKTVSVEGTFCDSASMLSPCD